jgi:thiamine biosynthesis protein ThiC
MIVGVIFKKINATLGTALPTIEEEVEKRFGLAVGGADIMDLSTGKTFTKLENGSSVILRHWNSAHQK